MRDTLKSGLRYSLPGTTFFFKGNVVENRELLSLARIRRSDQPLLLIVLGSGMNRLFCSSEFTHRATAESGLTEGHPMEIGVTEQEGSQLLVMVGRRHLYEGEEPQKRYYWYDRALACEPDLVLLLSAAGGLNPLLQVGDVVLHTGYLAPTVGVGVGLRSHQSPPEIVRERSDLPTWSRDQIAQQILDGAMWHSFGLETGTYGFVPGPSYETRAEIRMLRRSGADLVGMSTVPEATRAAERGVPLVSASLVTNRLSDTLAHGLDHTEVTDASLAYSARLRSLINIVLSIPFLEKS